MNKLFQINENIKKNIYLEQYCCIPFKFKIPDDTLPSVNYSCYEESATLNYYLIFNLYTLNNVNLMNNQKLVFILSEYKSKEINLSKSKISIKNIKNYLFNNKGTCRLEANINNNYFKFGDDVIIQGEINNNSKIDAEYLIISFIGIIKTGIENKNIYSKIYNSQKIKFKCLKNECNQFSQYIKLINNSVNLSFPINIITDEDKLKFIPSVTSESIEVEYLISVSLLFDSIGILDSRPSIDFNIILFHKTNDENRIEDINRYSMYKHENNNYSEYENINTYEMPLLK